MTSRGVRIKCMKFQLSDVEFRVIKYDAKKVILGYEHCIIAGIIIVK